MNRRQFCGLAVSTAAAASGGSLLLQLPCRAASKKSGPAAARMGAFFFHDGDRVVMIGDSITEQHLHSNYVEIYTVSRFPAWNLRFRNAGIGGDTSRGGNARTERDILSFNPTAVTITFGMNDGGYQQPYDPKRLEAYREGLQGILEKLKPAKVRVAVLSSSPVQKKEDGPALEGYNQTLETFASNAREIALANGALFVDQLHPHLAALQKARDADPKSRINGGDAVHPGPPGQLLMAWAILKGLHAPALVSSAEIDGGRGRAGAHENCSVKDVRKKGAGLSFTREDRALPFWIPTEARPILKWSPIAEDLDQYVLKITRLPEGPYKLSIDGVQCGIVGAAELARGYNMALLADGPIAAQARGVHDAVFAKNKYYHDQIFRGVVLNPQVQQDAKASMIAERMHRMEPLEKAIRDQLVLKPHLFEVAPV